MKNQRVVDEEYEVLHNLTSLLLNKTLQQTAGSLKIYSR